MRRMAAGLCAAGPCAAPPVARTAGVPSICLLVARWGGWPPWLPLLMRSYAANADVSFTLLGDLKPLAHFSTSSPSSSAPAAVLPPNVRFVQLSTRALIERLVRTVGFRATSLALNNHSTSKISDLKPMFGEVFADDLLAGCACAEAPLLHLCKHICRHTDRAHRCLPAL